MREFFLYFILHYWMTLALASSCISPKYAATSRKPVEVYQIVYFVEVNSSFQEDAVQAALLGDSLKLPSGTVCKYELGICYDRSTFQTYTWQVSKNVTVSEVVCNSVTSLQADELGNKYIYEILTLRKDPLVQFLVVQDAVSLFFLQLFVEETFCGKKVWRTDQNDLVVAVGNENFIDTVYEFSSNKSVISTTIYDFERKDDAYTSMVIKCELYSFDVTVQKQNFDKGVTDLFSDFNATQEKLILYTEEIAQLKSDIRDLQIELLTKDSELAKIKKDLNEVFGMKAVIRKMQKELNKYKDQNVDLKDSLDRLQRDQRFWNCQNCNQENFDDADEMEEADEVKEDEGIGDDFPQNFANILAGYHDCPDCILFPHEDLFSIVVALIYVSFSIMNTIMNYFSLRMLRSQRRKCFIFYTLTQGLTTRYICRSLYLTKKKVDKWLLDIVE